MTSPLEKQFPRLSRREDEDPPFEVPTRSRFAIRRVNLTLALSGASFLLAGGGVAVSLFMYWNSLQALQQAETDVARQTEKKVTNEITTTAAEAKYADRFTSLQTQNEALKSDLTMAQEKLAKAEEIVAQLNAKGKAMELGLQAVTTGDPEYQAAMRALYRDLLTPIINCLARRPDETPEAFKARCDGKGLSAFMGAPMPRVTNSGPLGLTRGAAGQPPPPTAPSKLQGDRSVSLPPLPRTPENDMPGYLMGGPPNPPPAKKPDAPSFK